MLLSLLLACTDPVASNIVADSGADTAADVVEDTAAETDRDCTELRWHDGDVALSRQADLDAFCDDHNAIRGSLSVDVGAKGDIITELDGIGCLCEVSGDLTVYADALPKGAPPPPHVTGDLELNVLQRIGGDLRLRNLANLTFLQELWSLTEVGGDIDIERCPDLQYATLFALQTLGGTLRLQELSKLLVFRMPSLTSAGGFSLGSPGDSETMFFFTELGIEQLSAVSGDIEVYGARNLGRLSAPVLSVVGGALHIEAACSLTPALPALTRLGSLHIAGNCGIADLSGLGALSAMTGTGAGGHSLFLDANDRLSADTISAFTDGLSEVSGKIHAAEGGSCATLFAAYTDGYCP